MAKSKSTSTKRPAARQAAKEPVVQKGYAGTQDYATGKVQSDPSQATPEQLKADRARQRGSL